MNTPFYSIIVVSRNAGDKLSDTLQSILGQTFPDYEIIVKDAMSSDGSLEKLPSDPRIRLIRGKDRGIYDGMNIAVECARGEEIYFLNCGDRLHDGKVLERVYDKVAAHRNETGRSRREKPAIYYGDVLEEQSGQHVMANPKLNRFAMFRYLPCHQACFYDRDIFEERAFLTEYRVRADYEHFLWAVIRGGAETVYLDLLIADYEGGGFSETREGRKLSKEEHRRIAEQYFTPEELQQYRRYLILTLQPLREKLARWKVTAAIYDAVKNAVYRKKQRGREDNPN